ncbi:MULTISPECIES: helix-turn-helix domain-containing protein [unclassified Oribacterium]|uniref:helix-turn-helix domain-containing protein n=1 Tax=unclassified Oribacterium TaxID=2629782 RepID=UPI0005D236C9|nr:MULTISPECIES: helix-turn-helix transcriptional regulator [unclassified Oribacterium]MBP3803383.1 helix-turn-helix transcriptional regulator [Oribacterium sp.]MBR1856128.1 helix-turn-helix transcriptional regulator [Oribacterium sp.]MCR5009310.1 helix-turn-helix transcriptional regulator [Oribacterium sp.]SEA85089.1 DNA-binding transcriptional regulator, XRE-family HTH domain [Oribacterium sp. KHPX15]
MSYIDQEATGELLRLAVKSSSFSVSDICKEMNISTTSIYNWFRGDTLPSIENLFLFAELVGQKVDDIVVYVSDRNNKADAA